MSTTQAFCPAGTTVKFASAGVGGSPTYDKTLGEVVSIKKTGQKMSTDDATHLLSPNNYKELMPVSKKAAPSRLNITSCPVMPDKRQCQQPLKRARCCRFRLPLALQARKVRLLSMRLLPNTAITSL
jgi:hypothetical protein